jgi:hypothetical protein
VAAGNRRHEAFTEVQPGGVSSSENLFLGGRPCPVTGKAPGMTNANGEFGKPSTESKSTSTVGNLSHGSREIPASSASPMEADRSEKANRHTSDMHGAGKSDRSIVPEKPANNERGAALGGVGGGTGPDQGERPAIAPGPDSTPERGRFAVPTQVARIVRRTGSGAARIRS